MTRSTSTRLTTPVPRTGNTTTTTSTPTGTRKWLAFMERRLKLARRLLNPESSVLIVTIRGSPSLRMLLQQTFSDAKVQLVTTIINPAGAGRAAEFSRTDEYRFCEGRRHRAGCRRGPSLLLAERAAARAASVVIGRPKGHYRPLSGRRCAVGALCFARHQEGERRAGPRAARRVRNGRGVARHGGRGPRDRLPSICCSMRRMAVMPLPHPVVAKALLELAEGCHLGDRYRALTFEAKLDHGRRRTACIDGSNSSSASGIRGVRPRPAVLSGLSDVRGQGAGLEAGGATVFLRSVALKAAATAFLAEGRCAGRAGRAAFA